MSNTRNLFKKRVITVAVAGVMAGQVMQNAKAATNTVTNNLAAAGVTGNQSGMAGNRYDNMFTQVNLGDPNGTYSATRNVTTGTSTGTLTIGIAGQLSSVTNRGGFIESQLGLSIGTVFGVIATNSSTGTTTEYHRVMVKTTTNVNVNDYTTTFRAGSFNATAMGVASVSGEVAVGAFAVRTSYNTTSGPSTYNTSANTTLGVTYATIDGTNSRFLQSSVVNGVEVTNEASSELDVDGLSVDVREYDENAGTDTNSEFDQRSDAFWLDVNDNVENTQAQLDIETDNVEIEVEDNDGEGMGSYANFGTGSASMGVWDDNAGQNAELIVESTNIGMGVYTDGTGTSYSEFNMGTGSASLLVTNELGNTHGLWVGTSSTQLSGGSNSTTLDLSDSGVQFINGDSSATLDMNNHKITEVTAGDVSVSSTDAVNGAQLYAEASTRLAADGNRDYNGASTNNAAIANDGDSLTTAINGENTRAINAEGNRDYNAGMAADGSSLTTAINTEQSQRVAAVAAEASTREAADLAEASTRLAADNAEASTRLAADGNRDYNAGMAADGSSLTTAINTEQSQRVAADVAEASTRLAADNLEAATRANADAALQANIDTETAARRRADRNLNDRVDDVEGGVAAAIALTSAQQPSAPGKTAVSIGAGFYAGEQAIGINAVHKLANNGNVGVGIAQSTGDGDTAAKVSYGFEF